LDCVFLFFSKSYRPDALQFILHLAAFGLIQFGTCLLQYLIESIVFP